MQMDSSTASTPAKTTPAEKGRHKSEEGALTSYNYKALTSYKFIKVNFTIFTIRLIIKIINLLIVHLLPRFLEGICFPTLDLS